MGWGSWGTWLNGVFSSMYFMLNSTAEAEGRAEPVSLNIQHTAGGIRPLYTPYYSRWDYQRDYQQDGASEQAAARLPGYSFQYYEQQDMDVDWTRQTREMEEPAEWFRQIQDIYMEEIQTVYTQVPKEEVRSLAALCREHPASDLAEATSVILSVLENSTSYTLTPGSAPVNTDIVEYFLFDSREGYCVHYASAATLMYRLYGIPARYGAGYAVQPSDFVLQEDGTWVAEVTDESAHAWTEIFLEDYGWTPVEVTPASDGSMLASYPGFDAAAAVLPQVRVDRPSERGRGRPSLRPCFRGFRETGLGSLRGGLRRACPPAPSPASPCGLPQAAQTTEAGAEQGCGALCRLHGYAAFRGIHGGVRGGGEGIWRRAGPPGSLHFSGGGPGPGAGGGTRGLRGRGCGPGGQGLYAGAVCPCRGACVQLPGERQKAPV